MGTCSSGGRRRDGWTAGPDGPDGSALILGTPRGPAQSPGRTRPRAVASGPGPTAARGAAPGAAPVGTRQPEVVASVVWV
ncbi:hypothetical protein GCM10009767_14290 [Kocuria aegyptia]|uniref:Uncharacterized protein n=1 Tax=Kocuria aegyptia TaxID=330943 RepID=A0ABP4WJJ0_9MICC